MSPPNAPTAEPVHSEFAGEPDFHELLVEFAAALPDRREGLIAAQRGGEYDVLRIRAHQLKGAGGGFGFPRLSELAAELERACCAADTPEIAAALESLVGYINRITV